MCGLTGYLYANFEGDAAEARQKIEKMTRSIAHRGPDAEGFWLDQDDRVALGHRRLSILDLTSSGAQPMLSDCGRYVLAYNGEIYNHLALRAELEAADPSVVWKGHSDTETLLVAIVAWGLKTALQKACGMFAVALWDRKTETMVLARDRMGEKPLYFAQHGSGWMFGSELRVLLAGGLPVAIDPVAVGAYLRLSYVPDHLCILQGVRKVMPGLWWPA